VGVLLLVLVLKSIVFDPVNLEDPSEIAFANWVETKIEEEFDGFFYNNRIFVHRLVSVKTKNEEDEMLYIGRVRRYFLGVLPLSEQYIKEKTATFE